MNTRREPIRNEIRHVMGATLDGLRSIPNSYRRRSGGGSSTRESVDVTAAEARELIFCFGGEFGYELLSWLPYLRFLAHDAGLPLRTCSRPGSRLLYDFSEDHIEVPFRWRPDQNGTEESARAFRAMFGDRAVFPASGGRKVVQDFRVGGYRWEHQDVHARLTAQNYRIYEPEARVASFLSTDAPVAVINNKDFDNWFATDPQLRESFDASMLRRLRDALHAAGFFVVYHRFDEPVPENRFPLDDAGIFDAPFTLDMREVYAGEEPEAVMRLQMELYSAASLAICPQGGNSFLPIMSRTRAMILSKARTRLVEYQDLASLYDVRVDVFTSADAIVDAVRLIGLSPSTVNQPC